MKKSEIMKIIKRDVSLKTPDVIHKIDLNKINIESKQRRRFGHKSYAVLASIVTVMILLVMFWPTSGTPNQPISPTTVLKEKNNAIGFSALSSVIALNDITISNDPVNTLSLSNPTFLNQANPYSLLEDIDILEDYYPIINTFLTQQDEFGVNVVQSDNADYEYKMIINFADITGSNKVYDFYYNETLVEDEDNEQESTIEGFMLIGNDTYEVNGERSVSEAEESLEMQASLDDENYVVIEYETETEQTSQEIAYYYEVYQNNTLIRSMEIEFEDDDEETEMAMVFLQNNIERYFSFEVEVENGIKTIEIEFEVIENDETIDEGTINALIEYDEAKSAYTITYRVERDDEDDEVFEDDYDEDDDDEEDEDNDDDDEDDEDDDL